MCGHMTHDSRTEARPVREAEPRMHTKLMRNHFQSAENVQSGVLSGFLEDHVVDTIGGTEALSTSLWASQRQMVYRFGWINAVFNPRKVLLGDDPECLKDDDRERTWL